jgi:hypothetical protein
VIERKYHNIIQAAIDEQLVFTPEKETRNRKLLEQPGHSAQHGNYGLGLPEDSECSTK